MYSLAAFIMRGRTQSVMVAVVAALLSLIKWPITSPFSYLSGAAIALVTLRRGGKEGLYIVTGTLVMLGLLALFLFGDASITLVFFFGFWLPVWLMATILRSSASWKYTLQAACLVTGLVVVMAFLGTQDLSQVWYELLEPYQDKLTESGLILADQDAESILRSVADLITGFIASSVMLGIVASVVLGRWWQALLYNPGGFKKEFHQLNLGRAFSLLVIGLVGAALLLGSPWIIALAIVAFAVFLFQGLSVVHSLADKKEAHKAWLVAMYAAMLIAFPQTIVLVSMLGIVDNWWDFRARVS